MILSHIVAVSENNVIGSQGKLPWHLPEDLRSFKERTSGHIVIMGRKTFESLKRPLPNRHNVVISRNQIFSGNNVVCFSAIPDALHHCETLKSQYGNEVFIIGGAEIYQATLPLIDHIYLTKIHSEFKGDAFYPKIDANQFVLHSTTEFSGSIPFSIMIYNRKTS